MIFGGLKLPAKLQRHVANLSSTVQVLLAEVILYAEGLEAEANISTGGKLKSVMKAKKSTELLASQLECLVGEATDDIAIATAAAAGRSTKQIADFFGFERDHVRRRLRDVRALAEKAWDTRPAEEPRKDTGSILELFAESGHIASSGTRTRDGFGRTRSLNELLSTTKAKR